MKSHQLQLKTPHTSTFHGARLLRAVKKKVQNATVVVGTLTSDPKEEMVSFDEGGAIVEANPCLYQRIRKAVPKIEN